MFCGLAAAASFLLSRRASSKLPECLKWPALSHTSSLSPAFDSLARKYTTVQFNSTDRPLYFCVVGSGPAGFYTVSQLLKSFGERARVAIIERLPTPFGLVRSGVAPDHPETKNVIHQFTQLGEDPRVEFFGNVKAGTDISLSSLRSLFDGVILAYGAESNRTLNIPGRHLEGIFTAREFVWWYNGHPEYCSLPINLSETKRVSILGLGNVALDCARVLLQPPDRLKTTDIASHALDQLQQSAVEQVDLIGRRGPAQAAFTAKELREVLRLEGIRVVLPEADMRMTEADEAELKTSRSRKRVFELLRSASDSQHAEPSGKDLQMHFFRTPVEAVAGRLGRVEALKLERTRLQQEGARQLAVPTGEVETLLADMVLESIGYRSLPMPGAPFDEQRGIIPNRQGRVMTSVDHGASIIEGLYVCGWVKRGPSGIIGTNLIDASETVQAIAEDARNGRLGKSDASEPAPLQQILQQLEDSSVQVVSFDDWLKIDAAEKSAGEAAGRPRAKFTDIGQMLGACQLGCT